MRYLYALVCSELERVVLNARAIDGFFLPPGQESDLVRIAGTDLSIESPREIIEDVEILILDTSAKVIGSHYIGRIELLRAQTSENFDDAVDVTCYFGGMAVHHPGAQGVWRRWATGRPTRLGEWRSWPPEMHRTWVYVVGTAWSHSGYDLTCYSDASVYVLPGADVSNWGSFYCALGEAINGPGGYFGRNASAFEDCLRSCRPEFDQRFRLRWLNFDESSERLAADTDAEGEELDIVLTIFRENGVDVVRE